MRLISTDIIITPEVNTTDPTEFLGKYVSQWCEEATTNITHDEDSESERYLLPHYSPFAKTQYVEKGDNDCACTGVEVNMAHQDPNVNALQVVLETVGKPNSDRLNLSVIYDDHMNQDTIDAVVEDLWKKKFSTRFSGDTEKVFSLFIGAQVQNTGEVNEGLRGFRVADVPRLWVLVFMVDTNRWDWTTLTHELGHYIGIHGHWNGNQHPTRIMASEPHDPNAIPGWKKSWYEPAVTMTQEECAYWRGAWDRLTYDNLFYPEGRDDENFSYFSESNKRYWNEWINKEGYLYLERPDSPNSP